MRQLDVTLSLLPKVVLDLISLSFRAMFCFTLLHLPSPIGHTNFSDYSNLSITTETLHLSTGSMNNPWAGHCVHEHGGNWRAITDQY